MSRWDPRPTSGQRWMVRHRTELSVGVIVFVVLTIGGFVYCLVTSQFTVLVVLLPTVAIAQSINFVYMSREASRSIEKYDSIRD